MQYLVGALIALTLILPLWHTYGMGREFVLSAGSGHLYEMRSDNGNDGASKVALERKDGTLLLTCELVKKFEWPYCGYYFLLGKEPRGVDLSGFDSFSLDLVYEGPGPHMLRAVIRNFEPEISTLDSWQSQKINEIEFTHGKGDPATIPLKLLRTAAWWNAAQKVPLLHTGARVDNATAFELYTGSLNAVGGHRLALKSITFHGKWISQNQMLSILVAAWFCFGVLWPVLGLVHYRAQLRQSKARLASLTGINRALELEARELAGQAYTDPLTGALNRQGLRDLLMKQWKTPSLLADPSSVMFIDLDHFKQANDQHGHAVGDEVLRSFAAMVRKEIRSTDKLVRWGGEEFLILCPCTEASRAGALAEKLRSAMELQTWPCGLNVTASFGVTALCGGEELGEAIKRADAALYQAKSKGRNCVELALPALERK